MIKRIPLYDFLLLRPDGTKVIQYGKHLNVGMIRNIWRNSPHISGIYGDMLSIFEGKGTW